MKSRPTGLTQEVGWEVGVSRTFACSLQRAWDVVSAEGLATWLGEAPDAVWEPGASYETTDGTRGQVRSYRELDRIRLTWQSEDWDHEATVQVALTGGDGKATVRFHTERLASEAERERMRTRWKGVLDALAPLLPRAGPCRRHARGGSARNPLHLVESTQVWSYRTRPLVSR